MTSAGSATADAANLAESAWSKLRGPLLDTATRVCSVYNKHQWRPGNWLWNEQVDEAVQEIYTLFQVYSALETGGKMVEAKEAKTVYIDANHMANQAIWWAMSEVEKGEFAIEIDMMFSILHKPW